MKHPLTILTAALLFAGACNLFAQDEASKAAFANLSKERRDVYQESFKKAVESYNNKKILSAIQYLNEADKVFSEDANLKFFMGLCHAELRAFDKANAYYDEALKINPKHIGTLLNKAEVSFFNGEWKDAYQRLTRIQAEFKGETVAAANLIEFKILMCASKLAQEEATAVEYGKIYNAKRVKYTINDDTPYFFYASALNEYRQGKKSEGLGWVLKAYNVFADPGTLSVWDKIFIDAGYLQRHEIVVTPREQRGE